MRLRKTLEDRYNNLKTDALLLKVLATQEQASFDLNSAPAAGTKVSTLKEAI
ncbi:hypothetical protein A259_32304 [Pseudomonas syringae pv. actinidiae ICMP 19070]|nr:hypothetical protein A259_32304 [Pseudomonas syringae pv. actinidiae ICMP 19070]